MIRTAWKNCLLNLSSNSNWIFLYALPLLILYLILIISGYKEVFVKDEWRYVYYAQNLLQGLYSPEGSVFLWNGPGYPLFLVPFLGLGIPLVVAKFANAIFLYLSVAYIFKSLLYYFSPIQSLLTAFFLGFYLPAYEMIRYLMTEPMVFFLFTLFTYLSIQTLAQHKTSFTSILPASILLAFICLTKVIVGYVLVVGIVISGVTYLWKRKSTHATCFKLFSLAFIFCIPYLIYTYSISGKVFYWSNAGGMQLYWMSSPYEDEYGDWINFINKVSDNQEESEQFRERHGTIIAEVFDYPDLHSGIHLDSLIVKSNLKQDEEFKRLGIDNIKHYPFKYAKNWLFNISRMLIDTPYSYKNFSTKTFRYLLFHLPALLLLIALFFTWWKGKIILPFSALFIMVFAFIYFVGSSLVSAYPRQFYVIFPMILFLSSFHIKYLVDNKRRAN